jgi:hypothetical protein
MSRGETINAAGAAVASDGHRLALHGVEQLAKLVLCFG